jgi:hypothetical protein
MFLHCYYEQYERQQLTLVSWFLEKDNTGYVVFKLNIHGPEIGWGVERGRGLLRPSPPLSTGGVCMDIGHTVYLKTT